MLKLFRKSFVRDKGGQALVEATIAGLISISAFFWIMEWGMCLYCQNILTQAAQYGVQYATTHGEQAYLNTGVGSGPATNDLKGATYIVPAVEAWMAQSALKASVASMQVCAAWWPAGTAVGGLGNTPCTTGSGGASNAMPGTVVSVQVYWTYKPYVLMPGVPPTLSYTATGTVVY